jgi:hypothetical protein
LPSKCKLEFFLTVSENKIAHLFFCNKNLKKMDGEARCCLLIILDLQKKSKPRGSEMRKRKDKIVLLKCELIDHFAFKYNQEQTTTISMSDLEEHPAFLAFTELEQTVFRLHRNGVKGKNIACRTKLNAPEICRMLQELRRRLHYLVRFRDVLLSNSKHRKRFLREFIQRESENAIVHKIY